jgi:hypothetical protein
MDGSRTHLPLLRSDTDGFEDRGYHQVTTTPKHGILIENRVCYR